MPCRQAVLNRFVQGGHSVDPLGFRFPDMRTGTRGSSRNILCWVRDVLPITNIAGDSNFTSINYRHDLLYGRCLGQLDAQIQASRHTKNNNTAKPKQTSQQFPHHKSFSRPPKAPGTGSTWPGPLKKLHAEARYIFCLSLSPLPLAPIRAYHSERFLSFPSFYCSSRAHSNKTGTIGSSRPMILYSR